MAKKNMNAFSGPQTVLGVFFLSLNSDNIVVAEAKV